MMDAESVREYCLGKKGASESFPFGNETLVFKVREKIFVLVSLDSTPLQFNVKCDPEEAIQLRERYNSISPGYHMNKRLWNTIVVDGSLPDQLLKRFIDQSYLLVVGSLPQKKREGLNME